MRVMVDGRVLTHLKITGVERYARGIISALSRLVDELIVAQPHAGSRLRQHVWEQLTLPQLARNAGVDVLFCPANLGPVKVRGSYKQVVVLHSVSYLECPESYSWVFRRYYAALVPRIATASSAVVTVSETERETILKHYPWLQGKLFVVPNGIDDVFRPDGGQRDGSILYVGSLSVGKNLRKVLEAYELACSRIPHRLVLVGSYGDQFRKSDGYRRLLSRLPSDRLHIAGQVNDAEELRRYYCKADFLIFPSLYEASPLPPTEAMACGTPVIASDTAALRERCQGAAVFCEPNDPRNIADRMVEVATQPQLRASLVEKGLAQARKLSWEETARQTLKVYQNVYNEPRG